MHSHYGFQSLAVALFCRLNHFRTLIVSGVAITSIEALQYVRINTQVPTHLLIPLQILLRRFSTISSIFFGNHKWNIVIGQRALAILFAHPAITNQHHLPPL
jgi:ABC-type uncharacterized transport system permease subunit